MHSHRGNRVCSNSLLVSQEVLESQILHGLQAAVPNPAVLNYTLKSFERQRLQQIENHTGETGQLAKKIADLSGRLAIAQLALPRVMPSGACSINLGFSKWNYSKQSRAWKA